MIKQKTDNQKLQEWLLTIPVGEYRTVINSLIKSCKVNKYIFGNWRYGPCRIPELAKDKIEEIAGKKIF